MAKRVYKTTEEQRAKARKYYWDHREQQIASAKRWQAENLGYLKAYRKADWKKNKKKRQAGTKKWRKENYGKYRAIKETYRLKNLDKWRESNRRYRAKKKAEKTRFSLRAKNKGP